MKYFRRRASVVVVSEGKILGFRAQDPSSGRTYFLIPGGQIEDGEAASQAAIRETLEETGYHICLPKNVAVVSRYDFEWHGKVFDCETIFFIGELLARPQEPVEDAAYHRGVEWLPVDSINEVLGYHQEILDSVLKVISLGGLLSVNSRSVVPSDSEFSVRKKRRSV